MRLERSRVVSATGVRKTEVGTPLRMPLFITWMVLLIAPVRGSYLSAVHRRQDSCHAVCSLDFLVCLYRTHAAVCCDLYTVYLLVTRTVLTQIACYILGWRMFYELLCKVGILYAGEYLDLPRYSYSKYSCCIVYTYIVEVL